MIDAPLDFGSVSHAHLHQRQDLERQNAEFPVTREESTYLLEKDPAATINSKWLDNTFLIQPLPRELPAGERFWVNLTFSRIPPGFTKLRVQLI